MLTTYVVDVNIRPRLPIVEFLGIDRMQRKWLRSFPGPGFVAWIPEMKRSGQKKNMSHMSLAGRSGESVLTQWTRSQGANCCGSFFRVQSSMYLCRNEVVMTNGS